MKRLGILWLVAWATMPCLAATPVTVVQLRELLRSTTARGQSDAEIAGQLASTELAERFDLGGLPGGLGPKATDALRLLSAESAFLSPAADLILRDAPPTAAEQAALLSRVRDYTQSYIRNLPDFVCMRTTRRYDDKPDVGLPRNTGLHARDLTWSELTFSHGQESDAPHIVDRPVSGGMPEGLTSYGEFGSIVGALFVDSVTMTWSRWERLNGVRAAVFSYSVDAAHSRYSLAWCCHGSDVKPRQVKTAYAGEIFVEPGSGAVVRIVRKAAPPRGFPTHRTDTLVEYRPFSIAGRTYLCPARSVIVSEARAGGSGFRPIIHYVNEGQFADYRKFVTSSVLNFAGPEPEATSAPALPPAAVVQPPQTFTPR